MTDIEHNAIDGDWIRRFLFEGANVRGVIVRLGASWRQIKQRDDYPAAVAGILGEMAAASTLMAGDVQMAGKISVQLRTGGAFKLGFVECNSQGHIRGLARWDGDVGASFDALAKQDAVLAITIEREESGQRYQGLVPLERDTLAACLEGYFEQSEQLPTAIHLFASDQCAAGLLLQQVPAEGGHRSETDAMTFDHARILAATITASELFSLDAETLLRRLFAEDDVRLFEPVPVRFKCSCSSTRVADMLRGLGREEAFAAIGADGVVEVFCEFCNQRYAFDPIDLEQAMHNVASAAGSSLKQ